MEERAFEEVFRSVEVPLRRALISWYGPTVGRDATAAALAWAWQNRSRLDEFTNLRGYLFRVGQSAAKRSLRPLAVRPFRDVPADHDLTYEPALRPALEALSDRQRTVVLVVHGYGYSYREAAELLDISVATLRTHLDRAMTRLRNDLEVPDDARTRG